MDKGINIELFVTQNMNGFYYITTSHNNICNDNNFAKILKMSVKDYQEILIVKFNGKYSNKSKEVYFLLKRCIKCNALVI